MPKYTFICPRCNKEEQNTVPPSVKHVACENCYADDYCNKGIQKPETVWMQRQMPKVSSPNVTEVVDKYTGITWTDGQQDLLKERRDDFYWSVEVPRLVNSGTYSVQTMLENGWIWVDDHGKIQVYDKPPAKR